MKKLFLASFFALLSLCANAYDFEVDGICYNITGDNTVELADCSEDYTGDIIISNSVTYDSKNYSVTSIRAYAFYGCSGLTSISLPGNITSIGDATFELCSGLTSINIPENVTSIGRDAFAYCILSLITNHNLL